MPIPVSLQEEIPDTNRPYHENGLSYVPYLRVVVSNWTENKIYASSDNETDPFIIIDYAQGGYNNDLRYIRELLKENMQLNLLDVRINEHHEYVPKLIVAHPDYLIDPE